MLWQSRRRLIETYSSTQIELPKLFRTFSTEHFQRRLDTSPWWTSDFVDFLYTIKVLDVYILKQLILFAWWLFRHLCDKMCAQFLQVWFLLRRCSQSLANSSGIDLLSYFHHTSIPSTFHMLVSTFLPILAWPLPHLLTWMVLSSKTALWEKQIKPCKRKITSRPAADPLQVEICTPTMKQWMVAWEIVLWSDGRIHDSLAMRSGGLLADIWTLWRKKCQWTATTQQQKIFFSVTRAGRATAKPSQRRMPIAMQHFSWTICIPIIFWKSSIQSYRCTLLYVLKCFRVCCEMVCPAKLVIIRQRDLRALTCNCATSCIIWWRCECGFFLVLPTCMSGFSALFGTDQDSGWFRFITML